MAAHPRVFEADDPIVDRVRKLCAPYPEYAEVEAWGRATFRAGKKIFVVVGSSPDNLYTVIFKPSLDEYPALIEHPHIFSPPYFGPGGWLAIEVDHPDTDWRFVAELIDTSYRRVALKRQLVALDASPVI